MLTPNVKKPKGSSRRGGKKNRKIGRNRAKCELYRREGRRERNKARRAAKLARRRARRREVVASRAN